MPIFIRLVVCLLTSCVLIAAHANPVHAQGTLGRGVLENPGDGQHYSGIGVISGWHCLGGRLTISFNGDRQLPLAYGSQRLDAQGACGGHEDVGFGSIYNWALLGAGTHTAVAYRDGVEFARSTFTVGTTTAGDEFLTGVSAQKTVRDFPREDETTVLTWNEDTQHLEIDSWQPAPRARLARQEREEPDPVDALLESPRAGHIYSGIGIIRGWKCAAVDLTARVNNGPPFPVLYGNLRADTRTTCGDSANGFVVPSWNWGILGPGEHTLVVYDLGVEFARSTFRVGTAGEEFVRGVSRRITVFGFPHPLVNTDFAWNENTQHFEMIGGPLPPSGPKFGSATIADQTYTQGTAIASLTLPDAGGGTPPLVYSLSPALPAGLRFNQTTRELSGTPTSTLAATTYTYTVTDANGETATLTFSLTVEAQTAAVSFGSATIAAQSYTQNTAITSLTLPAATGGTAPLVYSLSPALPAGLSFNASTRVLSGTPTATQSATTYTYTVTDRSGATAALSFSLTVEASATSASVTNSFGMELVLIPAGTFQMGSPASEPDRYSNEELHQVTISQAFYLGKYEVTQAEWKAVMGGDNPSHFSGCTTCPVEQVSWNDVQGFIEELNLREGVTTYRLPTEAEWEYAARAGTQTAYSFGNTVSRLGVYAWYSANSGDRTHPVGGKRPNAFGLYDMHGNVWELVADWYGAYPRSAVSDPRGPFSGAARVNRGGGWHNYARDCRAALRHVGDRNRYLGFRLARTP